MPLTFWEASLAPSNVEPILSMSSSSDHSSGESEQSSSSSSSSDETQTTLKTKVIPDPPASWHPLGSLPTTSRSGSTSHGSVSAGNVRTVQAFAGEEKAVRLYRAALLDTYKYGRKAGLAKGLGLGTLHCVLFLSWSLLVWYTSIVVHKNIANGGDSFTTMLNVVIAGLYAFPIPSGKIVALVGGSGSGKSTVVSLIERFYEPLSGRILLDGTDIRELDLQWLRQQIGLVNQEPALFATTIRENILYGKDDATLEEITRAAKLSEAITFINNLPDRLETQVGERGIQLLGGQKQRIAISRAIDEATSALDAESEKSVQEALDRVMVGRTTIVVAHRLSTVRNADVIAVVQGGKIVETGSHDQLISKPNSAYASLIQLQEAASLHRLPSRGPALGQPLRCYICIKQKWGAFILHLVRLEVMGKKAKNATFICGNEAAKISKEIQKVEKRRIVKSTLCNERSSRSHCMVILDVPTMGGQLMLVDMAGSENIEQAGQNGLEAKMQTGKINQGNIALKRVVESIANGDSHVPFRDSKLTMLLQDSFEDDKSKILMILCASPDPKEMHKTISTLEYGAKAKCIVRGPHTPLKDKHGTEDSSSADHGSQLWTSMFFS
ncbi:hypothetical protein HYC85_016276 [Camellia sinensis]|uniref:ABC transporter domain-containing protein n=1 Tax=Camellia sinensis TaxID=4442 RepID=A0A7J7H2V5_CAMSI|nr:hypothetical protein HYC85_016276 [Camellia sinensis]